MPHCSACRCKQGEQQRLRVSTASTMRGCRRTAPSATTLAPAVTHCCAAASTPAAVGMAASLLCASSMWPASVLCARHGSGTTWWVVSTSSGHHHTPATPTHCVKQDRQHGHKVGRGCQEAGWQYDLQGRAACKRQGAGATAATDALPAGVHAAAGPPAAAPPRRICSPWCVFESQGSLGRRDEKNVSDSRHLKWARWFQF